jgi:hypothetical protein
MVRFIRMEFRRFLSSKNVVILLVTLALLILTAGYFTFRKPQPVAMDKYAPATALAYIEINSLTELIDGLTSTNAWHEVAPVLGLSSQLKQLGSGIGFMSNTGLGPDEVVIAGRAQYAVVVTGLDAGTGANEEGVTLNVKPRFALLVETHSSAEKAAKLAADRAAIIAKRIFGDSTKEESSNFEGTRLMTFRGEQPERQLVAAASGSLVLIANHESPMKACLEAIAGRTATLAQDETLKQKRGEIDNHSAIFAYVTKSGIEKFAQFGPAIFATRFTNNPDALTAIANLFGHISNQTADAMLYSLQFEDGAVTENYLLALRPAIAAGLRETTKPATGASFAALQLIPKEALEGTILNIETVGVLPENLLKQLSPSLDLVAGLALREFVISFRKQLALEPSDTLDKAIGNEIALIKMNQSEPVAMLILVKDRNQLLPAMNRYLAKDNARISSESYHDIEIRISSNEDGRAAAFIADFLVLGTSSQIKKIIDTKAGQPSAATDLQVAKAFTNHPQNASIIAYEADTKKAGEMMLTISKLTRVTDGARELLEQEPMQKALSGLPYSTSVTSFRDSGVFTQTHSAVGIFRRISDWLE